MRWPTAMFTVRVVDKRVVKRYERTAKWKARPGASLPSPKPRQTNAGSTLTEDP